MSLSVCHVIAGLRPEDGGPSESVPRLARSLVHLGQRVSVVFPSSPDGNIDLNEQGVKFYPVSDTWKTPYRYQKSFRRILSERCTGCDVIHNHGLWLYPNRCARLIAEDLSIPLVVSPRGMLLRETRARSHWKKQLCWLATERANLSRAALVHVTTHLELRSLRMLGVQKPIALIPNGIDAAETVAHEGMEDLFSIFPGLKSRRVVLFLGRLHARKGIDLLLRVWSEVESAFPDWILVVAGEPKESAQTLSRNLQLRNVLFTGWLKGNEKKALLQKAELLLVPSDTENFGNVIFEGLAVRCHVITTFDTDEFAPFVKAGALSVVKRDAYSLSQALEKRLRKQSGSIRPAERLLSPLLEKYRWNTVAEQMIGAYEWLLGRADRPAFVDLAQSPDRLPVWLR